MILYDLHLPSERRRAEERGGDYLDQGGRVEQRIGTNGNYTFLPIALCLSRAGQEVLRPCPG